MTAKIWVDCDGVLCDFVGGYLDILNEELEWAHSVMNCQDYFVYKTHADVTTWDMSGSVCSKEDDDRIWRHIAGQPGWAYRLQDIGDISVPLRELRALGDVGCVTSPSLRGSWMEDRACWLIERGFNKRDIVFAEDKKWVSGAVLIDDKIENCLEWQEHNPYGTAILFDQPWNQSEDERLLRACSWDEVIRLVKATIEATSPK